MIRWHMIVGLLSVAGIGIVALVLPPVDSHESVTASWLADAASEAERSRSLDVALLNAEKVRDARTRIVRELKAGTLSMEEALEQGRRLNADDPICTAFLAGTYPECSDQEIVSYQLLVAAVAAGHMDKGGLSLIQCLRERIHSPGLRRTGQMVIERRSPPLRKWTASE